MRRERGPAKGSISHGDLVSARPTNVTPALGPSSTSRRQTLGFTHGLHLLGQSRRLRVMTCVWLNETKQMPTASPLPQPANACPLHRQVHQSPVQPLDWFPHKTKVGSRLPTHGVAAAGAPTLWFPHKTRVGSRLPTHGVAAAGAPTLWRKRAVEPSLNPSAGPPMQSSTVTLPRLNTKKKGLAQTARNGEMEHACRDAKAETQTIGETFDTREQSSPHFSAGRHHAVRGTRTQQISRASFNIADIESLATAPRKPPFTRILSRTQNHNDALDFMSLFNGRGCTFLFIECHMSGHSSRGSCRKLPCTLTPTIAMRPNTIALKSETQETSQLAAEQMPVPTSAGGSTIKKHLALLIPRCVHTTRRKCPFNVLITKKPTTAFLDDG